MNSDHLLHQRTESMLTDASTLWVTSSEASTAVVVNWVVAHSRVDSNNIDFKIVRSSALSD